VGDACAVPVGDASAKIRVNIQGATPTQLDVTIEPLVAMPPGYRVAKGKNQTPAEPLRPAPLSNSIDVIPPGLPIRRTLHLDETLDIPVPEAGIVHLRFPFKPQKGGWDSSGIESVSISNAAPAPLVGTAKDWPGSEPKLRTDGPTILFQDPAAENPKHLQYSFRKFFENYGPRGDLRWISLPGLGRFVLSLQPRPELGFRLAGEVQGTTIRVALDGVRFDVLSAKPSLDSPDVFRLYARVEPDDEPLKSLGVIPVIGSVDIEDLTPLPGR
jgi:hypothetical protein